jgi:hypothetical protein
MRTRNKLPRRSALCGDVRPHRRAQLHTESDAVYFYLYGMSWNDTDYLLETLPIVRWRDEDRYSEYRTKRLILGIYDAVQKAMDNGVPYQTILDPPPGHGPCHPNRLGALHERNTW